jgi:patatin-like phospholipase/acyl hydrolase
LREAPNFGAVDARAGISLGDFIDGWLLQQKMTLFRCWVLEESEEPSSSLLSLKLKEMELETASKEFEIQLGGEAEKNKKPYALVQLHAAAMNHRDLWIRKKLYPGIKVSQRRKKKVSFSIPAHSPLFLLLLLHLLLLYS